MIAEQHMLFAVSITNNEHQADQSGRHRDYRTFGLCPNLMNISTKFGATS